MTEQKYYKVTAMCGHVTRGKYILIDFPVIAENGREASARVRVFPRVKHNHKDAIISCLKISFKEYKELKEKNNADEYLHCKNIQDQSRIKGFEERLISYERQETIERDKSVILHKIKKYNHIVNSYMREITYEY